MPIPLETMLDQVSMETRNAIDASTRAIIADNRARYDGTDGRHRGPPHLAEAVFRWSLRHADRAAILMDLNRRFDNGVHRHGHRWASLLYWLDTARAVGPLLIIRLGEGLAPSWLSRRLTDNRARRHP